MYKIMICYPGTSFSSKYVSSITNLLNYLDNNNISYNICNTFTRNIYETRNRLLMGDPSKGESQKPFDGQEYTHILWIDDDITFSCNDFIKLLEADKDFISGLYLMANNTNYAVVEKWDEKFFSVNGYFEFLSKEDLNKKKEIFKVSYTGFGFVLIKKGVFESINYPWFDPAFLQIKQCTDFSMEDVSFCLKCKDKGIPIYIHPEVVLPHHKNIALI